MTLFMKKMSYLCKKSIKYIWDIFNEKMYILYYFNGWKLAGGCKNNPHRPDQNTPPQGKPAMTKNGMDQLHVPARLPSYPQGKTMFKGGCKPAWHIYVHKYAKCVPETYAHTPWPWNYKYTLTHKTGSYRLQCRDIYIYVQYPYCCVGSMVVT